MSEEVFKGIKVLDFGWAVAIPWSLKYLADHGATVIHVESTQHPDFLRTGPPFKDSQPGIDRSYYFSNYHCNKYGMALNMRHPRAREIIGRLVQWADIVVENFAPGVMAKWGLAYEDIKKLRPDVIMLSSSQMGQDGPLGALPGSGIQLAAYAGLNHLTGWEDRQPCVLYGGFTDCPAGRIGGILLVAALLHRRRTGQGMYLDLSQLESAIHMAAPIFLDYQANQRVAVRQGNRHPFAAPHGVYPCRGEDQWCAIAVFDDGQWKGLCAAMGNPAWCGEERFAGFPERKNNEDALNELIAAWTAGFSPEQVMELLWQQGVPAGKAQKSEDLYQDPQLAAFAYFTEVDHPVIGRHKVESQAFRLSKTPWRMRRPAPCMGEHTEWICRDVLKLGDEEFIGLLNEGAFE